MQEQHNLEHTDTFGPVLEQRPYTEDEKIVLEHFFTNTDRNIYAATDAMPNALWALLEGGYSRSQVSMRQRFLQIFKDMEKEVEKGTLSKEDLITIEQFAQQIRSSNALDLSFFMVKAEKFMRKWAVQYGHDSLKDSDNVRFAIENISQFATTPVEEARLGAYQEKSTRYVPFSKDSLIVPTDLKEFEEEIRQWNNLLMDSYENSRVTVSAFIAKQLDQSKFKTEAAFKRTVNAKTFDIIRYFLPGTLLTSLGVVWQTREAERHISKLMSDPQEEIRAIGEALLREGKKVSPGLLSHVQVNAFQQQRQTQIQELHSKVIQLPKTSANNGRESSAVQLVDVSEHVDAHIAATILFEHKTGSFHHYLEMCKTDFQLTEQILDTYLKDRSKFDSIPISAETGRFLFEVTMDYGAYRDVKRHRKNFFLCAPLTALQGIEYPEYVEHEQELTQVKQQLEHCATRTEELHKKILAKNPHLAQYILMFAHKQTMLWQMDPRQLAYVVELRTTPAGHHSYRTICQEMFRKAQPHIPILRKYIRVDLTDGKEGRKKQEERTVEKLKALGADTQKVS